MVEQGDGTSPGSLPSEERERSGDGLILSQESSCRHERGFKRFPSAAGTTPGVVDSRNLRVPPTRRLPEPSSLHEDLTVNASEDDESDATFKPPVSVIVIQKPPPTARQQQDSLAANSGRLLLGACPFLLSPSGAAGGTAGDGFSPFITSHVTSSSSMGSTSRIITANSTPARPRAASLSSASAASPFRLQPRNPPKLGPSPSAAAVPMHAYGSPPRASTSHLKGGPNANVHVASSTMTSLLMSGNSHRGRKRRAHSMSTYPEPPLVMAAATTPATTALHGKAFTKAARGGAKAAQTTPPTFTCSKASGGYMLGAGTPGDSVATETTVRDSLLGTPLQDVNTNSPTSSTTTPASPPGRVLPTATPLGATSSSLLWQSGPHKPKPSEAAFGADVLSTSPGAASVHMMNFQGLSLLSPPRSGPGNNGDGLSLDGSAAASPASSLHGSQASHARSCFSKYQHHPQHHHGGGAYGADDNATTVHRVASQTNHVLSPQSSSTPRSMAGGSPKIAPLIVLGGPKSWYTGSASAAGGASSMGAPAPPNNVTAQLESAAALMDAASLEGAGISKATRPAGCSPRRALVPSPDAANQKKRPPLHQHRGSSPYASAVAAPPGPPSVNWMHSLDGSAADEDDDPMPPAHSYPPSTVLCHPSTPGSTLSQDAQPRYLKAAAKSFPAASLQATSRKGPDAIQDEEMPRAPPSDACTATGMTTPSRGGGRVRRSPDESPGKRSVMSMSPTSTPLPRLTLTPRSTTSSHAARQLFLSLPTPNDLAGSGGAGIGASSEALAPPPSTLPSPRRNSYIPLPEWAATEPLETSMGSAEASSIFESRNQRRGLTSSHPSAASAALMSTSLLAPPSPNDAIERFLKNSSCSAGTNHPGGTECMNVGVTGRDDDSLSASDDDDEAFFLATPLAIHEEKQSSLQQSKQRKLREQSHTSSRSQHSFASSNIMQASSTSLRGMNFVTSSTSLDKIGGKPSSGALCLPQSFSSLKRQDSQTSIGLTLEGTNAPSSEDSAAKDASVAGGRSSSSFSRSATTTTPTCFARDLVTPPVMAQPKSPPPLPSPRINTATTAAAALPRSVPNHRSQRCEDLMELDGSDWSPTTSPPPSTSSRHRWPCAGEAESPMDPYSTRVYYSSTAPDGSPSD